MVDAVLLRYSEHVLTAKRRLRDVQVQMRWPKSLIEIVCFFLDTAPVSREYVAHLVECCDDILDSDDRPSQKPLYELFDCDSVLDALPEGFSLVPA